ncbi:MAG: OmpA family protein [Caulobacter sp.]|nr:OmpA family protein [Caulobacter sp.]
MTYRRLLMTVALAGGLVALGACSLLPKPVETARFTPCSDISVAIYFQTGSARISRDAKAVLKGAADQAAGCRVNSVDVMGLADPVGDPAANLKLSEQRATAVTRTLRDLGIGDARVTAAGESGAVTEAGAVAPLRRRTEVTLRLSPAA